VLEAKKTQYRAAPAGTDGPPDAAPFVPLAGERLVQSIERNAGK
jgi:hypothetical protein